MRIAIGSMIEHRAAMQELMAAHWAELGAHAKVRTLKLADDQYALLEQQGMLFSLFAYSESGDLVGYSLNILANPMHSVDTLFAENDALFLHRSERKGTAGLQLMRETEKAATERGARIMVWHAREGSNLDKLLPQLGCEVLDVLYSKEL